VAAVVADDCGRARLNPFTPFPLETPAESCENVYSGAPLYSSCIAPLSLRLKADHGAGSDVVGGATNGQTPRQPPVQFDTPGLSAADT